MEKKPRYMLEYTLLENNYLPKATINFSIPYPLQVFTYSCSIGNSSCCNYYFTMAY